MARIKEQILCDTTSIIEYDVYIEHCEINDLTPQGEDSEDFYNVAREYQVLEFDDLLTNLRYCKANNYKWVVSGTLGLWNGRHEIEPKLFNNLINALNACFGKCDDIIITKSHSVIKVTALHHDGRNYFELRALSDLGEERANKYDGNISFKNKENLRTLDKWLF